MIEKVDPVDVSSNASSTEQSSNDILGVLTTNEKTNTMLKDKIYTLMKAFAEVYNTRAEDKYTEEDISSFIEKILKFDLETIMNILILKVSQLILEWWLTQMEVAQNADYLLAIDPETFKTVDDIIERYNYLKCIWLNKITIDKNTSEILKENHEHIYELFDNFNLLVSNPELSWIDYWYTWWLVGYFWTGTELIRYHTDLDVFISTNDLVKVKKYIEEHKECGFRFINNLNEKGVHGHEYMLMYKDNPLHIWFFLFRKKNDKEIQRVEYGRNQSWGLTEYVTWVLPYDVEEWVYNNRKYRRQSLASVIEAKCNSNRIKDTFDASIFMEKIKK